MSVAEQLRACCAALDDACGRLTQAAPESLDACSSILQGAVESLVSLQPALCSGDAPALAEAWQLRRSVRRAGALLEHAAAYHRRWQESILVQTAGYGPDGRPGDALPSGRIFLRA